MSKQLLQGTDTTVVAILVGYNERDIIRSTIRNALNQGIDVYFADDSSTDGTLDLVAEHFTDNAGVGFGTLPTRYHDRSCTDQPWDMNMLVKFKEDMAHTTLKRYQWIIHMDCDEVFTCPWAPTVREGLQQVPSQFGVINCTVHDYFPSTDDTESWPADGTGTDVTVVLSTYRVRSPRFPYQRCLRNSPQLMFAGTGHRGTTHPSRLYTRQLLMKHYPYRSASLGTQKVHRDRIPRICASNRQKKIGCHYALFDGIRLPVHVDAENERLRRTRAVERRFATNYLREK